MQGKTTQRKFLLLIFTIVFFAMNILVIFQSNIIAKPIAKVGYWGTSISCTPGTVVDWQCYEGTTIECIAGETGRGYCP